MVSPNIAPSMLSCDFAILSDESKRMIEYGAHSLHMDVMDGHFVPNITLGAPIIKSLRKHTDAFLDCHLMVSEPRKWVADFAKAGASQFTFHIEVCNDPAELIKEIRDAGMKVGIALKPNTPVTSVFAYAESVDLVLVMTKMMPSCLEKVKVLREKFPSLNIQVDGGIDVSTIEEAAKAGANVIVSGTGVFGHANPRDAIKIMTQVVEKHVR